MLCGFIYFAVNVHDSFLQFKDKGFFELQYFTVWGVWMTMIYFLFATITHVRYEQKPHAQRDSHSMWHSWKWHSSLFMTALLWECVIASVYWTILYPSDRARLKGDVAKNIWNVFDHAVPIIVLFTDWFLNRIYFEWNQLYPNMIIFLFYGLVNLTVTYVTGVPVYEPMSWDSVGSWFLALAMIPLAALYWVGLYYLTRWKFRKMEMHD